MYFRFTAGIMLAVLISMAGVTLEKQSLDLRREVTRQYYQSDVLTESFARLRLRTQQLSAPQRVVDMLELDVERLSQRYPATKRTLAEPQTRKPRNQLLRWQLQIPKLRPRDGQGHRP